MAHLTKHISGAGAAAGDMPGLDRAGYFLDNSVSPIVICRVLFDQVGSAVGAGTMIAFRGNRYRVNT